MSGNAAGGKLAAAKNLANDPDFYKRIGRIGGKVKSPIKGFGSDRERASWAGRKGGLKSKRVKTPAPDPEQLPGQLNIIEELA